MQDEAARKPSRSPRWIVAGMLALANALFFFVFVLEDIPAQGGINLADLPWGLLIRYAVAMAIGGAIAGFCVSALFGRAGLLGWTFALIGGVLATLIAGIIGSAIGRSPELLSNGWQSTDAVAVAAGLILVPLSMIDFPWMFLIWLALVLVTHIWAKSTRT